MPQQKRFFILIMGCLLGLVVSTVPVHAQASPAPVLQAGRIDTVRLVLPDAEQRFFQNNLAVLA